MRVADIKKTITIVEEIASEGGRQLYQPLRRAACVAVIGNPFAGRYEEDLSVLIEQGEQLGHMLGAGAAAALAGPVESYGKGGVVGIAGELEHIAAILHPKFGAPLRDAVGGGKAIIPSAKKRGGPGVTLDVPLHFKDAAFVRTHFDAMEIRVQDAPAPGEIVVAVAVTNGGRPHPRTGGLQKTEVRGEDGLR